MGSGYIVTFIKLDFPVPVKDLCETEMLLK